MTYVVNPHDGSKLICCWDDCETAGHDEIRIVEQRNSVPAIYIFCSEAHKSLHKNSHISYGNLGLGDRGLIRP